METLIIIMITINVIIGGILLYLVKKNIKNQNEYINVQGEHYDNPELYGAVIKEEKDIITVISERQYSMHEVNHISEDMLTKMMVNDIARKMEEMKLYEIKVKLDSGKFEAKMKVEVIAPKID